MKGMAQLRTEIPTWFVNMITEDRVDEVIRNRLHVKRVLKNDGDNYCHNKIVMVDDKLMYVGSDNAYPSYNEEHGVWIDHQDTIKGWKKDYWDGLWAWSTDTTD
jgi:phosphatidylserine/phosphatidylglycerophosphate/cardiolipin synthase-like enzyme